MGPGKARDLEARPADTGMDSDKQQGRGGLMSHRQSRTRETWRPRLGAGLWNKVRSVRWGNKEPMVRVTEGEKKGE